MLIRGRAHGSLAVALTGLLACGGDDSTGPTTGAPVDPDRSPARITAVGGGGGTARVGTAVATPPSVVVRDEAGEVLSGIEVTFSVESGGGSVGGATAPTDSNGIAQVGSWTVGPTAGENRLRAAVTNNPGLSATFSATARWPHWTAMVYMAADNNLTVPGIEDIDELEAAGVDPEVNVVVQAEFSPTQLAFFGCDASCFNRPNFNTFRYLLDGAQPDVFGPNGAATDIGNRDMTDPDELAEFISWARQVAPAEHYVLVLWNHGGGYAGLLQDETTAGSQLMELSGLRTALASSGPVDIIDFDMCLMAGYETLSSVRDGTGYAVFSEELVPGAGNPYREWLERLQEQAAAEPGVVAASLVDAFHEAYVGARASTTKSAYSLSEYPAFESQLADLADLLRTNLVSLQGALDGALQDAQKFAYSELTDLVTFLDLLRAQTTDPSIQSAVDALRASATSSAFRLRNQVRNGTDVGLGGENDVERATGLHLVLPRGVGSDRFADSGPRSFAAYEALYGGLPWTEFLDDWIATQTTVVHTDQGSLPFQGFLVWDSASVQLDADVDLWILEPNGNLYVPWLGSVTPNGTLTNDSFTDLTWYEG